MGVRPLLQIQGCPVEGIAVLAGGNAAGDVGGFKIAREVHSALTILADRLVENKFSFNSGFQFSRGFGLPE